MPHTSFVMISSSSATSQVNESQTVPPTILPVGLSCAALFVALSKITLATQATLGRSVNSIMALTPHKGCKQSILPSRLHT